MTDLITNYWFAILSAVLVHPLGRACLVVLWRGWVASTVALTALLEGSMPGPRRVAMADPPPPRFTFEGAALRLYMDDKISAAGLDTLIGEGMRAGIMARVIPAPFDLDALLDAVNPPKFQAPRPFIHQCDCKGVAGDVGVCDNACRAPGGPRGPAVDPESTTRVLPSGHCKGGRHDTCPGDYGSTMGLVVCDCACHAQRWEEGDTVPMRVGESVSDAEHRLGHTIIRSGFSPAGAPIAELGPARGPR